MRGDRDPRATMCSINTSFRAPNTTLSVQQLQELDASLEETEDSVRSVLSVLRTHTTCEYAIFELDRVEPLIGKARISEVYGIVARVLFQSVPQTPLST
jgi:hypothetical protein